MVTVKQETPDQDLSPISRSLSPFSRDRTLSNVSHVSSRLSSRDDDGALASDTDEASLKSLPSLPSTRKFGTNNLGYYSL